MNTLAVNIQVIPSCIMITGPLYSASFPRNSTLYYVVRQTDQYYKVQTTCNTTRKQLINFAFEIAIKRI